MPSCGSQERSVGDRKREEATHKCGPAAFHRSHATLGLLTAISADGRLTASRRPTIPRRPPLESSARQTLGRPPLLPEHCVELIIDAFTVQDPSTAQHPLAAHADFQHAPRRFVPPSESVAALRVLTKGDCTTNFRMGRGVLGVTATLRLLRCHLTRGGSAGLLAVTAPSRGWAASRRLVRSRPHPRADRNAGALSHIGRTRTRLRPSSTTTRAPDDKSSSC